MNSPSQTTATRLIIINQTISESFFDWVRNFAEEHGPVELWTGNPTEDAHPAIKIRLLPKYNRNSAGTRLVTWLRFTLVAAWLLIFVPRRIPVFSITNPPFMPLVLSVYRALFRRRYALLEYDIYPQVMTKMGIIGERHIVYKVWYRWHGWAMRKASTVITISDVMASELQTMTRHATTISVVPTWTDTDHLKPLPKSENPFIVEHHLEDKLVVLYSGNLGATHAIETILNVAEKLQHNPKIQFVIIGEGTKKTLIEDYIARATSNNILLLPLQPRDQLPYSLSSGDIAFVTLAEGYERLSMPSKTYDMMATGNAILGISASSSSLESVIQSHGCGVNFSPDQAEDIAAWIEMLTGDAEALAALQKAARRAAEKSFSAVICQSGLTDLINALLIDQ
jgi:glycosyltransferase involved in cell wall biosynthesis